MWIRVPVALAHRPKPIVRRRQGQQTRRPIRGTSTGSGTPACLRATGDGHVVFSYGVGVTTERNAGHVTPELAEERRRFREAIGAMVRGMRLGEADEKGKGISQAVLAERVGVSRWTISQVELGNSAIGSDVLFSIFRALADFPVDMREVFEDQFDKNWNPKIPPTDPSELRKRSRNLRLKGKPSTRK